MSAVVYCVIVMIQQLQAFPSYMMNTDLALVVNNYQIKPANLGLTVNYCWHTHHCCLAYYYYSSWELMLIAIPRMLYICLNQSTILGTALSVHKALCRCSCSDKHNCPHWMWCWDLPHCSHTCYCYADLECAVVILWPVYCDVASLRSSPVDTVDRWDLFV